MLLHTKIKSTKKLSGTIVPSNPNNENDINVPDGLGYETSAFSNFQLSLRSPSS